MLTEFSLYNESEMRQWDDFVESHPKGTPFHLSCWLRVINETYSYKPHLFVLKSNNGEIAAIFPFFIIKGILGGTRMVSIPFSDYGGPLFSNNSTCKGEVLHEIARKNNCRINCVEIRGPLSINSGFICHNYYKQNLLDLSPGIAELKKKLHKRTIVYSIRKAQKSEVTIKEESTRHGIKEFYRLNLLTRKKHGVPFQPILFFEKIFDHMISKGFASILVAVSDSKTIAASLFLKFKDTVYYKYNASDPFYLHSKTPNHLLTWHAIERAYSEGYRLFDFGRSSPDNKGLTRYKNMWGTDIMDLPYYYYPKIKGAASKEEKGLIYRISTGVWRRLPDRIVDNIGPKLYKYLG